MKKLIFVLIAALFAASCTKKTVVISGTVTGGSPLDRVELINTSSVATLPIANFGVDANGNFSDTIAIPENGIYAISYGGSTGLIYLKRGENIKLKGQAGVFPKDFEVSGDAGNNQFLQKSQASIEEYFYQLSTDIIAQKEPAFIAQVKKFKKELTAKIDEIAKSTKADSEIVEWKKGQLDVILLTFTERYAALHGRVVEQPNFKVSKNFEAYEKELIGDETQKVKTYPEFRQYLLSKISDEYQEFSTKNAKSGQPFTQTFVDFLKGKKYSSTVRDYLITFVASSIDMRPDAEDPAALRKILDDNIENSAIKEDMHKIDKAVFGPIINTTAPTAQLRNAKGEKVKISSFEGKPTLLMFYSSWVPYIGATLPPMLKQISEGYKNKLNMVYVNVDDNFAQFKKTSNAMMKGISGHNLYADGALQSKVANDYGIYGFKLPSAVIITKDGKIGSQTFMNLQDPKFKAALDKATGIVGPPITAPQPEAPATPDEDEDSQNQKEANAAK